MSFGAIVFGILIWGAFPAIYKRSLSEKHYRLLSIGCRYIGIAIIACGVAAGVF